MQLLYTNSTVYGKIQLMFSFDKIPKCETWLTTKPREQKNEICAHQGNTWLESMDPLLPCFASLDFDIQFFKSITKLLRILWTTNFYYT